MQHVNIHDAKTHLSRLIKAAEAGEEVVIQRDGKPVVRLVAIHADKPRRVPGMWAGLVTLQPGVFDPLSDDEAAEFYGEAE